MKLVIVIPAYNEGKTISKVIKKIPKHIKGVREISVVVVDDNSSDSTCKNAKAAGAHVISHAMNLGAGGATLTGISYGNRMNADMIVTLDADEQHDPSEIKSLVEKYKDSGGDLIIGSRFLSKTIKNMPLLKKIGNKGLSFFTYLLSGKMLSDTQSGYRLFSSKMTRVLSSSDLAGYEFCSETIMIAQKNKLSIKEVPITTIYHEDRKGGQNPVNGINILLKLIYRRLVG